MHTDGDLTMELQLTTTAASDAVRTSSPGFSGALDGLLRARAIRRPLVVLVHLALWSTAFVLALSLRFDLAVPPLYTRGALPSLEVLLGLRVVAFVSCGLFSSLWRYADLAEFRKIAAASSAASLAAFALDMLFDGINAPRSLYVAELLLSIMFAVGARLVIRALVERRVPRDEGVRTLIIGAGDAGESLLRDVQQMRDGHGWTVVGFLDDDPDKQGVTIHGLPVLGAADEATLTRLLREQALQLVVLAIPSAAGERLRDLVILCTRLGVKVKTVPSLADRLGESASLPTVREVNIDDLLRREEVKLDVAQIEELVRGRVVLVTGAAGSIGSELCRQVLRFQPRQILLVEHDENALFFLHRELCGRFPDAEVVPLMADVTDAKRIQRIFSLHKPSLVLHAAAHKHVGMMERNPCEAAKNNVLGTIVVAEAANALGTNTFVLISTDKAVRPTSVMGATKRVTEMVIQHFAQSSRTRFVAVRFGNVLGSQGSVVPLFVEQIAKGGPVTVTDPEVSRFFMTIPEAAQLVLQAGVLGKTGEILMLDMGEPVKIVDLAKDLIELTAPGRNIEIVFTGLAQGEKLTEELLLSVEAYDQTTHPKIVVGRICKTRPGLLERGLDELRAAADRDDPRGVVAALSRLVPEATLTPRPQALPQPELHASRRILRAGEVSVVSGMTGNNPWPQ